MGANAQTTVPTFTAAQVLTADQMNQSARTGVPVFADTTARDAGFGGSGEKVLAEGQLCYVENLTGVAQIQYYDGAGWVSLTPGAWVRVGGSSFTTASGVQYDSIFSATYRNYVIIGQVVSSNASATLGIQLTSAGTPDTADYLYQSLRVASTSVIGARAVTQSSGQIISAMSTTNPSGFTMTLYNPNVALRTSYTNTVTQNATDTTGNEVWLYGGGHNDAGAFDGIDFTVSAGTITGVINIYGVTDS